MLRNGHEMLVAFMLINYDGFNLKKMFYFIYLGTLFENFNEALLFDKNKCSEHKLFLFNYLFN